MVNQSRPSRSLTSFPTPLPTKTLNPISFPLLSQMASSSCRLACRKSLSSIKSSLRSNAPKCPSAASSAQPSSSPTCRRFSFSRMPAELGCVQSMLPLHEAVAVARMTSRLSTTSCCCRSLSQELGDSVPR